MVVYARLLHNFIGNMPDVDFTVYRDISAGNRTIPNIMIALTVPYEATVVFPQNLANLFFIFRHLRQNRLRFHFENQMNSSMQHIVNFQHFRYCEFYPADENINGIVLK